MAATERVTVLLTTAEKRRIAKQAKAAGLSMAEFFRRAVDSFRLPEDDQLLDGMIGEMNKSPVRASAALDRALASIEASNKRIARMERSWADG